MKKIKIENGKIYSESFGKTDVFEIVGRIPVSYRQRVCLVGGQKNAIKNSKSGNIYRSYSCNYVNFSKHLFGGSCLYLPVSFACVVCTQFL
jgi:hypothetical protein|nr:MAG TPA: hypothetical protein [Caudoviricetes sp.]